MSPTQTNLEELFKKIPKVIQDGVLEYELEISFDNEDGWTISWVDNNYYEECYKDEVFQGTNYTPLKNLLESAIEFIEKENVKKSYYREVEI